MTCAALLIAIVVRMSVLSLGVDNFTASVIFIIVLAIQVVAYLSIHVVLQNVMIPIISKLLDKVPFIKKKKDSRGAVISVDKESSDPIMLEQIRAEQRKSIDKKEEDNLKIGLDYTRKTFALYLSDSDLELLCQNILIYIDKSDFDDIKAVKVKELTSLDIRHFGWNIWNRFKTRNQMETARFLKTVFPNTFYDTEIESIKSHLKDDEKKGLVKIEEKIN